MKTETNKVEITDNNDLNEYEEPQWVGWGKEKEFEENILVPMFKKLARLGYDYIECEDSEENVAENIRINEYTFTKDGEREDL